MESDTHMYLRSINDTMDTYLAHTNGTKTNNSAHFFDEYYSSHRFTIETIIAIVAVFANVFTLMLLYKGSAKQIFTAYRILFYNLLSANTLCCILSWFAINSLLIFERHLGILFGMSNTTDCTPNMQFNSLSIIIIGATLAVVIEGILYVIIIVISVLIYIRLRRYGHSFWNIRFDNQIRNQKRIFATTLMLSISHILHSLYGIICGYSEFRGRIIYPE